MSVIEVLFGVAGMALSATMVYYTLRIQRNLEDLPEDAFFLLLQHWRARVSFRNMIRAFGIMAIGLFIGAVSIGQDQILMHTVSRLGVGIGLIGVLGFLRNLAIVTGDARQAN